MEFTVSGVAFTLLPIQAGAFTMGSPYNENQHQVTLSQGFCMGETEVTQAQWRVVMGDDPSGFKGDDLPVEKVS